MTRTATFALAALLAGGSLAALAIADEPRTLVGDVWAIADADTLYLGGYDGRAASLTREGVDERRVPIRLWGVDAPETDQTCGSPAWRCGHRAAVAMLDMVKRDRRVTCEVRDRDRYSRLVARCSNRSGDLAARLVAQGYAVDVPKFSGGAYRDHEEAARAEKLGIWSGSFRRPEDWRREHRR